MKNTGKQRTLRPTANKVREAIFNILRGRIAHARFLDLYAGTGAVGIEALNEGADEVVFVEERIEYAKKIKGLSIKNRVSGKTRIITKKVVPFLDLAEQEGIPFDIIFLDPPYHNDEILLALKRIGTSHILNNAGTVIAEHFSKKTLPESFDRLHRVKDYTYGDTVLSVYEAG